jgi:hypothetical protein
VAFVTGVKNHGHVAEARFARVGTDFSPLFPPAFSSSAGHEMLTIATKYEIPSKQEKKSMVS